MKIARVFPHKKSKFTPTGRDCYFGYPDIKTTPFYDAVDISVVFTWDKERAQDLAKRWKHHADSVRIGGPAYGSPCNEFIPGRYVAQGITFTTRGCPNRCEHCFVPEREGSFKELPINPGHIIQDNNVLACSERHWDQLVTMLRKQRYIEFKGGLEARRLTPERINDLRSLRITSLWLACDTPGALPGTVNAIKRLRKVGFTWSHIYVYVLCGKDIEEEQARMEQIMLAGGVPFAQLYQPPTDKKKEYSPEWRKFQKFWARPASVKSGMKSLFAKEEL